MKEFTLCGSYVRSMPPLLFAVQVLKNVRDEAQAYLVYV
jgi:hypothetical protein